MMKLKKPTKPKLFKLKPPSNVVTIIGYAYEHLETKDVEFFPQLRDSYWAETVSEDEAAIFWGEWVHLDSINIELLEEFAMCAEVPLKDVFAVPGYDFEWSSSPWLEYRAIKTLIKEEFENKKEEFNKSVTNQINLVEAYKEDLNKYKLEKAKYDVWEAEQKLKNLKQ